MPDTASPKLSLEELEQQLSAKEVLFVHRYVLHLNASRAAREAGFSERSAGQQGYVLLRKPAVKAYMELWMEEFCMSAVEAKKRTSDMARASLNDYFKTTQVLRYPQRLAPLSEIIARKEQEIEDAEEFMQRSGLFSDPDEMKAHTALQKQRERDVILLRIQLKRNPDATQLVNDPPVWEDHVELDLVKLTQDAEGGKIKSFKMTEHGPVVELYAADGALRDILRIHGQFEKDNEQVKDTITIIIE